MLKSSLLNQSFTKKYLILNTHFVIMAFLIKFFMKISTYSSKNLIIATHKKKQYQYYYNQMHFKYTKDEKAIKNLIHTYLKPTDNNNYHRLNILSTSISKKPL